MMSMASSERSVHMSRRGALVGMYDCHEADEFAGGTPQQVAHAITKHDLVLAVNRTESLLHRLGI